MLAFRWRLRQFLLHSCMLFFLSRNCMQTKSDTHCSRLPFVLPLAPFVSRSLVLALSHLFRVISRL